MRIGKHSFRALTALGQKLEPSAFRWYSGGQWTVPRFEANVQTVTRGEHCTKQKFLTDTLLSSPGALSCDQERDHLFVADTQHHRVIIADCDGRILDCIGSSPGKEDGTFETAQMCYPASSVLDRLQNCLYIADSENHVVRRADLTTRTLGTVCRPTIGTNKSSRWKRLIEWMENIGRSKVDEEDWEPRYFEVLRNPWHLKFTKDGSLLVASQSFENLWVLDTNSGVVSKVHSEGPEATLEAFLDMAGIVEEMDDVHALVLHEMRAKQSTLVNPSRLFSLVDLISCVVRLHNRLFLIDTGCQMIRMCDLERGTNTPLQLSNLGLLGLPWWWPISFPDLPRNGSITSQDNVAKLSGHWRDMLHHPIHIRPGRFLLYVEPVLPSGIVWAAPLEVQSIWRQARGSVVELSMFGGSLTSHKISGAQLWIDDLDDLDDLDPDTEEPQELGIPQQSEFVNSFHSLLDASLGSGEAIFDAVLYLKLASSEDSNKELLGRSKQTDKQSAVQEPNVSEGQVFLKRLHMPVKFEIGITSPKERTKHIRVLL